jgi:Mg-chelatase subunit ChlD
MQSSLFKLTDGAYALRVSAAAAAAAEQRQKTHFILCIDTSDSMSDGNKLANVKHSASLVLHFLGPQDRLSIVTFGDDATIQAHAVACDPEQKGVISDVIDRIRTDGCTNLSGGLIRIREILAARPADVAALKTGILLLTDGHANRGVYGADPLKSVVRQLHETFPGVSLQVVGYGTDHNAELLKSFAELTQGTYSIVDDREGAATIIGESLGNLFSCVAQQVTVSPGGKLDLEGTQFTVAGEPARIQVGDIYEGNETLLLFKPKEGAAAWGITVSGTLLPSLESVKTLHLLEDANTEPPAELTQAVLLTRARYTVARLFKDLREYRLGSSRFATILEEVAKVEAQLAGLDTSIAQMLKAECTSIRNAVETLQNGTRGEAAAVATRLVSHEAYTNMARGVVAAITPGAPPQAPRFPRSNAVSFSESDDEEDPTNQTSRRRRTSGAALAATASQYMTTPAASRMTNRVTRLMATMSVGGEETAAAVHEAATVAAATQNPQ